MRRRRGGAGTPCHELRPPIPNAPSNRRSEGELEATPRVAHGGNGARTTRGRQDERRRCPCCGHHSYIRTRKPGYDCQLIVLHHCHFCSAGLDEIAGATGLLRSRLNEWGDSLDELGPSSQPLPEPRTHGSGGAPERGLHRRSSRAALEPGMMRTRYARRYLANRGLSKAMLLRAEVGYGDSFWKGCPPGFKFPIRNEDGNLVGYKERFWPKLWLPRGDKKERKSRTLAGDGQSWLYPRWALADDPRLIVVCEGEFDALLLNHHGFAASRQPPAQAGSPSGTDGCEGVRSRCCTTLAPSSWLVAEPLSSSPLEHALHGRSSGPASSQTAKTRAIGSSSTADPPESFGI